ncbi:hypothetical protein EWF20_07060 [Sulfolobus sp. S-194]|uniref:hypothetical protein n=1 Tax=Sulfolobus sp. S-194 TaxID=2512240 RepID=UPI001436E704|nr:hypothetical protein [Sulfolobus sp. S-194]QIW23933.1 hypothetical protein EWF20_07060 [Sulfolobus sp. S-194]
MKSKGICYIPTLTTNEINPKIRKLDEEINAKKKELIKRHFTDYMRIAVENRLKIEAGTDYVGPSERAHSMNCRLFYLASKG